MKKIVLTLVILFSCYIVQAEENTNEIVQVDTISHAIKPVNYDILLQEADKRHLQDSILIAQLREDCTILTDSIQRLWKEIDYQRSLLLFDDTCLARIIYQRTREPFDEKSVKKALTYYDKIYSIQIKQATASVYTALKDYQPAYDEIKNILLNAQSDIDRLNLFSIEKYKARHTNALKNSLYYKTYMINKKDITLPYLDNLIKDALKRLSRHSENIPADFSDLLLKNSLNSSLKF